MANETNAKRPDDLLVEIGRSIMAKALIYSLVGHFVLTILTSFSLFRDWTIYGVKAPSAINQIKAEERRKEEEAERKRKLAEKAEAAKKAAATNQTAKASAAVTNAAGKVTASAPAANATTNAPAAAAEGGSATPPEVKPLPPAKDFEYGDDLSLD